MPEHHLNTQCVYIKRIALVRAEDKKQRVSKNPIPSYVISLVPEHISQETKQQVKQ